MKRVFITIALIIIALSASAQSGRETGFVFRPEVSLGVYSVGTFENIVTINTITAGVLGLGKINNDVFLKNEGTSGVNYGVLANLGYQFNPIFYLGGGIGINGYGSSMSTPIYINPRIYLGDIKFSCFFDIKAGYAIGISGGSLNNDTYFIPNGISDKTNYYWDGNAFHTTENYADFVTIEKSELKAKGYYFSLGFGFEINRSSFGFAFDIFNMNLETTVQNHYYSYPDNETHDSEEAPTVYNNNTVKDDVTKTAYSFSLKYAYSIF